MFMFESMTTTFKNIFHQSCSRGLNFSEQKTTIRIKKMKNKRTIVKYLTRSHALACLKPLSGIKLSNFINT